MAAVGTEVAMPCMADSHLVWIMNWFCLLFWGLCELPVSYCLAINQGVIASLGHSFFFYRHDISEESFGSKVIWVYSSDRRPQRGIKKGEEEEFCLKNKLKLRKEKRKEKKRRGKNRLHDPGSYGEEGGGKRGDPTGPQALWGFSPSFYFSSLTSFPQGKAGTWEVLELNTQTISLALLSKLPQDSRFLPFTQEPCPGDAEKVSGKMQAFLNVGKPLCYPKK